MLLISQQDENEIDIELSDINITGDFDKNSLFGWLIDWLGRIGWVNIKVVLTILYFILFF